MKALTFLLLLTIFILHTYATADGYVQRSISEATNNSTLKSMLTDGINTYSNTIRAKLTLENVNSVYSSIQFVEDVDHPTSKTLKSGLSVIYDLQLADTRKVLKVILTLAKAWDSSTTQLVASEQYN